MKIRFLISCLLLAAAITTNCQQTDFPKLTGPYLGQKPPGLTPELFAEDIISTGVHEGSIIFSPDNNELYYEITHLTHRYTAITFMSQKDGLWHGPEVASFSGKYRDASPFVTCDNKKLFFCSNRPHPRQSHKDDLDIWFVERTGNGWGEPVHLGPAVNSDFVDANPRLAKNGTLYFASNGERGKGGHDIYKSILIDQEYQPPVNLGDSINSPDFESCPFVAPDESYMIFNVFAGQKSKRTSGLHISFKNANGEWGEAMNMGNVINEGNPSMFAFVSPDRKYLFFSSQKVPYLPYEGAPLNFQDLMTLLHGPQNGSGDIYWVSARIIEELRPKEAGKGASR